MSEKTLTDMNYGEFQALVDRYIERSSQQRGEMPAPTFFALLFEKAVQRVTETVKVEGHIVDGQLVLALPTEKETVIQARGNQILVGDLRIVVTLQDDGQHRTTA